MITPEYCRLMARYNAWQNRQLTKALEGVPLDELKADHGAFFGSILGTLNHILWGDMMWLSRLGADFEVPEGGIAGSTELCPTLGVWSAERFAIDGRITQWANDVSAVQLAGEMEFYSSVLDSRVKRAVAPCVVHMFNHQTHHRGQLHAMMTRTGLDAPVSDLFLMPGDA